MSVQDIGVAMVIFFVAIIGFFVATFGYNEFVDKAINISTINESNATVTVLQKTQELTKRFDYVGFVLLMGLTLFIIITGWIVGGHPMFSFIYFIVLVILVSVSSVLGFVWNEITTRSEFGFGSLATTHFPIANFILGNFPVFITIIGFIGMMVMFAKPYVKDQR